MRLSPSSVVGLMGISDKPTMQLLSRFDWFLPSQLHEVANRNANALAPGMVMSQI